MRFILTTLIIISTLPATVLACRGPMAETRTFFKKLPEPLKEKEVVARIKVISSRVDIEKGSNTQYMRITKVKVISPLKGIKDNTVITIISDAMSSCSRDPQIKRKQKYFIAGYIDEKNIFQGIHKGLDVFSL